MCVCTYVFVRERFGRPSAGCRLAYLRVEATLVPEAVSGVTIVFGSGSLRPSMVFHFCVLHRMPLYELMYIASAEASAAHVSTLLKKAGKPLQVAGGMVRRVDHLGLRPMAYRMRAPMTKKWHEIGRYLRIQIQSSPDELKRFETKLRQDDETIRFMTLKLTNLAPQKKRVPDAWEHRMPLDPALTAFVRKGTNLDYYAARTLLEKGLLSDAELEQLTANVKIQADSPSEASS